MKRITWNLGKNSKLKEERGVSMEQVYELIQKGAFRTAKNPSKNHRGQRMFVVTINRRRYAIPFTEHETHFFLRTIYEV
jgi:hypothetical protein